MKIGILTLPLHTNYGGILQAYALQEILERMDHEVTLLSGKVKKRKIPKNKLLLVYLKRILLKYVLRKEIDIFLEEKVYKENLIIQKYTNKFINRYLHFTDNELERLPINFVDAIVVGSDQIWRPKYYKRIEDTFLEFAKKWDIIRVAYAVSFGNNNWEYTRKQTKNCKRLIKKFEGISAREFSGVEQIKNKFERKAEFVLDPTLLLNVDDYKKLLNGCDKVSASRGDLMIYVLDTNPEIQKISDYICEEYDYSSFISNARVSDRSINLDKRIQPPVEQWLQGFNSAKFIITDSFHACVFSIIFNKPFIVWGNKFRGIERFKTLLSILELEDRLFLSCNDFDISAIKDIDWKRINEKLQFFKQQSQAFLNRYLNG